ncbi:serine/threonine-protein phosphatase 2A regulatory subunit B alpha isoform [Cricetulus griseus]|nr:serine/threonine-protein phosphatase 2A regulatory subunit B alpha isoform [Cricetulus griseus]
MSRAADALYKLYELKDCMCGFTVDHGVDDSASVLCQAVFEEPEDPSNRSFFSEIISSISDVKFSHSGRYIMTRDYLTVKVWDLNMENRPIETYQDEASLIIVDDLFDVFLDLV